MEIILKQDVKGTGKKGDIVKVSDGFARNKLIPSGLAVEATDVNKRVANREKANIEEKIASDKASAMEIAEKLKTATIIIKSKAGSGNKLFGSITSMDIAEAIKEQEKIEIDKKKIVLEKPIKELGETEVTIKLFEGISATVAIKVEVLD